MSSHPILSTDLALVPAPGQLGLASWGARRAQTGAELRVYRHGLGRQAKLQMDEIDSYVLDAASRTAMELELAFLSDGLAKAEGSAAAAAIVARHSERIAGINGARLTRHFRW